MLDEKTISNEMPSNTIQEKKQYHAPQLIYSVLLPESGDFTGAENHTLQSAAFQPS